MRKELMKYMKYRKRTDIITKAIYTAENIEEKILAVDIQPLFCFDVRFSNRLGFQVELVSTSKGFQEPSIRNLAQMQQQRTELLRGLNDSVCDSQPSSWLPS